MENRSNQKDHQLTMGSGDSNQTPQKTVYAIFIPEESKRDDSPQLPIFDDRAEALKLMKSHKGSRCKAFNSVRLAEEFVLASNSPVYESDKCLLELAGLEKKSPFSSLAKQETQKLRQAIEASDITRVKELVDLNPNYLVNYAATTPTILHEGFRLNALHICCRARQPAIAQFVLSTVAHLEFAKRLYSDQNKFMLEKTVERVTDLYVNTPDKRQNDSPLHMAVKYGCPEIVSLLVASPFCNKESRNSYGETVFDIICSRYEGKDKHVLKGEILHILEANTIVPVLERVDKKKRSSSFSVGSPCLLSALPLDNSTTSDGDRVVSYAGPMSPDKAERMWAKWNDSYVVNSPSGDEQWVEKRGRRLSKSFRVPWNEYWPFLDAYCDLTEEIGLIKIEDHLNCRKMEEIKAAMTPKPYKLILGGFIKDSPLNCILTSTPNQVLGGFEFEDLSNTRGSVSTDMSTISSLCHQFEELGLSSGNSDVKKLRRKLSFEAVESSLAAGLNFDSNDSREEEDEDNDVFYTPPSGSEFLSEGLFLIGSTLESIDMDVYQVLKNVDLAVLKGYPNLYQWFELVTQALRNQSKFKGNRGHDSSLF